LHVECELQRFPKPPAIWQDGPAADGVVAFGPVASVRAEEIKLVVPGLPWRPCSCWPMPMPRPIPKPGSPFCAAWVATAGSRPCFQDHPDGGDRAGAHGGRNPPGRRAVRIRRTPFVFATATANKVSGLSTRELVDIYAGKTEQWRTARRSGWCCAPSAIPTAKWSRTFRPKCAMRRRPPSSARACRLRYRSGRADSLEKIPGSLGISTMAR